MCLPAILAASLSSTFLLAPRAAPPDSPVLPNIIYIMSDDLGYAEIGCYGQTKIHTPNIDQLAKAGCRFTQFYASAPVCAPCRCSLMTGLHTGHSFIRDNREIQPEGQLAIPDAAVTIAERLKARGYTTGMIGKWGLGAPGSSGEPNAQGFDHWFGYLCQRQAHNHYPTHLWRNGQRVDLEGNTPGNLVGKHYAHDLMIDEAVSFISQHKDDPFFLYLPFHLPHVAIQVPEDSLAEYLGVLEDAPYDGSQGYLPHDTPHAGYAGMVTRLDAAVGRIVETIGQLGLSSNTLIVFTSDNGPTYARIGGADSEFFDSNGPLRGYKGSVWEGGIREPFIACWPGRIEPGSTCDIPYAAYDTFATLLDLAGDPSPPPTDGVSYAPAMFGQPDPPRHEYLFWEFPGYGGQQAVRLGDWKGVRRDMHKGNLTVQLFNLAEDIGETTDVAAEHPDIVARIEKIMLQGGTISPEFPFPVLDKLRTETPPEP